MRAFDFGDSIAFLRARIAASPQKGRGQLRRMAAHLGVHTTLVSQVLRKTKPMSVENALGICEYFGLSELETEYFLALVQTDRAGTVKLKKVYRQQAERVREKAVKLENRLPRDKVLSEADKAVFYSNWYYSAIRILTSIEPYNTPEAIANYLALPLSLVGQVLTFLVDTGLCEEESRGRYKMGPKRTLLETQSLLIGRHHANWRQRAIEQFPRMNVQDFAFTAPLSISEKGYAQIRKELALLVEKISAQVAEGTPEKLICLNIDWLEIKP